MERESKREEEEDLKRKQEEEEFERLRKEEDEREQKEEEERRMREEQEEKEREEEENRVKKELEEIERQKKELEEYEIQKKKDEEEEMKKLEEMRKIEEELRIEEENRMKEEEEKLKKENEALLNEVVEGLKSEDKYKEMSNEDIIKSLSEEEMNKLINEKREEKLNEMKKKEEEELLNNIIENLNNEDTSQEEELIVDEETTKTELMTTMEVDEKTQVDKSTGVKLPKKSIKILKKKNKTDKNDENKKERVSKVLISSLLDKISKAKHVKVVFDKKVHVMIYDALYTVKYMKENFIKFLKTEVNEAPFYFVSESNELLENLELIDPDDLDDSDVDVVKQFIKLCDIYVFSEDKNQINISGKTLIIVKQAYENAKKYLDEEIDSNVSEINEVISKISSLMKAELYLDSVR
jgi:hypothetical protein